MSHVSALPVSKPGLDESAAEAAQYALQAFSYGFQEIDIVDAAVGAVSAAAVLRVVYLAAKHPSSVNLLQRAVSLLRRVKS